MIRLNLGKQPAAGNADEAIEAIEQGNAERGRGSSYRT